MEQTVTSLAHANILTEALIKPTIIRGVTLLAPGIWTGEDNHPTEYTADAIRKGFDNSDWDNMNLFLDHKDVKGSAVAYWIGFVRNAKIEDGELKGDLEVWHPLISLFIKQAKAQFGVSATMVGHEHINHQTGNYDYDINSFRSLSIVDDPGCGTCWLPKMLSNGVKGDKIVTGGIIKEMQIHSLAGGDSKENSNHNCKEVGKMTEENQSKKSMEDHTHKKDKKEKALADSKESYGEDVKNLNSKIDKLTELVSGLSDTVKNLSAEKESSEEESKEEENKEEESKTEESTEEKSEEKTEEKSEESSEEGSKEESKEESSKELEKTKNELGETKKELAALKEEVNSPDKKTLAGAVNADASGHDANAGMLGFFRESANIPIY